MINGGEEGVCPQIRGRFTHLSGVGEKKLAEYGAVFLAEIAAHLQTYPPQIFADDSFTAPPGVGAVSKMR